MATRFTLRNVFHTDADTYWSKIFFNPEYNRRLYCEGLGFKSFELLEQTGEPGQERTRKIRVAPKTDAPTVVTRLIGGELSYVETGRLDPTTGLWTFRTVPSTLADKVSIAGKLWVEPRGNKTIERVCETEIEVNILGVGGTVERFIEKTTRDSYAKAEVFTNAFIREKGL